LGLTKRKKGEDIMENQFNTNQFREAEIVIMSHWDKNKEEWVRTVYPKIGGRLRLAHEDNDNLSITTEIIKYDENIAVVRAVSTTTKGSFSGIGMSSTERDDGIAPASLEPVGSRTVAGSLELHRQSRTQSQHERQRSGGEGILGVKQSAKKWQRLFGNLCRYLPDFNWWRRGESNQNSYFSLIY
jgi:hypothetical protein